MTKQDGKPLLSNMGVGENEEQSEDKLLGGT